MIEDVNVFLIRESLPRLMPDFQGSLATFNPQWAEIPLDCCHCQLLCIFLLFTSSKNYILFMCSKISITLIFFFFSFFLKIPPISDFCSTHFHLLLCFISDGLFSGAEVRPFISLRNVKSENSFKTKHLCVPPTSTG